jgi:hypothetical protein
MRVTFTQAGGRRYTVTIERDHGPRLVPRSAPGYDDHLPHDIAHYLIEETFGIELGVFGQLAAGGGGVFAPSPADRSGRTERTSRRIALAGRADMGRSERLVYRCVSEWEVRTGRRSRLAAGVDASMASAAEIERAVRRLDEVSARWRALPVGGSLTFEWPKRLVFDAAGSRRGRATERRNASSLAHRRM